MTWHPLDDRSPGALAAALAAVLLAVPPCACAGPTDPHGSGTNLVPNGSFEQDGRGTLDTWQLPNPSLAAVAHDAAPGGGEWSLRLAADQPPSTGQARFRVAGLEDGNTVRLSAYLRAVGGAGGGRAGLEVTAADGRVRQRAFDSSASTEWTRVSVTERLSLAAGDTVWVVLESASTELEAGAGLFDLVTLERLGN